METHGSHSVYWYDDHGMRYDELRFVTPEIAGTRAVNLCRGIAARLGIVRRVIVTDGGDCMNFEWKYGEGVVFPPAEKDGK